VSSDAPNLAAAARQVHDVDPTTPAPTAEQVRSLQQLEAVWRKPRGLVGFLTTTNHKDIGLRFVYTAFVFFFLAGLLALAIRVQLAVPNNTLLGPDLYNQFFTTHGSAMMFLFAVPVMEGMAIYLVPLMVGTRNTCFPRLMSYGYWVYLMGGITLFIALALNFGPDMGWFSYTPLAGPDYSPGKRVDFWSQMVTLVEIGSMSGAIATITTILKCRAPGMALNRIPLFVWAALVAAFMILFAMPAVTICSTLLSMDRLSHVSTHFFNHAEGGDHLLWQHLFWFFGHPDVYIIFLPATGFISAIIPTFARRKIFGYTPLVLSMIAIGFIGFGVWVHHMFVTPIPELGQGMFTASSLLITIPTGVQIFCWTATLWLGRPWLKSPLLFVLGFFGVFIMGGLTGVMIASVAVDTQAHDTFFVVAHLHYVLIGGMIFPLLGAILYWFPKWTGKMPGETLAKWSLALLFIGTNLTFYPLHHLGMGGMPRRIYTYLPETGWQPLNMLATLGAFTMGIGFLIFVINLWLSSRRGAPAGPNPWHAGTLEWATTSPPSTYNFANPPTCEGRDPVWDNSPDAAIVTNLDTDKREVLCTTTLDAQPHHRYEMSGDSWWPLVVAIATTVIFVAGFGFTPSWILPGCAILAIGLGAWFWVSAYRSLAVHHPEMPRDPRKD
jgi:cytochrome c oxidase subunit 1